MLVISILLLILPGFLLEYLYEANLSYYYASHPDFSKPNYFFRFLRSLFFNVPATGIVWLTIWVYKLANGFPMVKSFTQFIDWSLSSAFLLHYVLVLLAELVFFHILFMIYCKLLKLRK